MTRFVRMIGLVVLLATVAGCASTSIRNSWVAPGVQGPLGFQKTLVVFIDPVEATRRAGEDALVARIGSDRAVASHTMFTTQQVQNAQNESAVRTAVDAAGIDSAVVLRVVDEEQTLNYTPGMTYPSYYGGFYGYYGYGWGAAYSPGYMTTNTVVSVETNLYRLDGDELVWSGVTETMNPSNIGKTVNEIADAVGDNLTQRGLISGS